MKHSYVIIDDNQSSILETKAVATRFQNLQFVASANNYEEGLDLILEHNPAIVFLEIDPEDKTSNLSLALINELHRYLKVVPKIIVTSVNKELAFEAIKYEVLDYCVKPLQAGDLRKALLRLEKNLAEIPQFFEPVKQLPVNETEIISAGVITEEILPVEVEMPKVEMSDIQESEVIEAFISTKEDVAPVKIVEKTVAEEKPLIICVKSYGDYRFIEAKDICYLQADNNSTDIHLYNGEMITAFKTLKHFENVLASPFVRIHNSYIVNIDYVSRIHTGNSVCYIKNTTTKLPFSKSYKENVDSIINSITNGNYLEI